MNNPQDILNQIEDFLNQIEDFLVNKFSDEDDVTGNEAKEMLRHICDLIESNEAHP